jgi:hypothetical protein
VSADSPTGDRTVASAPDFAEFAKPFHRPPDQLGPEHVRTFFLNLLNETQTGVGNDSGCPDGAEGLLHGTLKQTWSDEEVIKLKD